MQQANEMKASFSLCFVHCQMASDSFSKGMMKKVLRHYRTLEWLVQILENSHESTSCKVDVGWIFVWCFWSLVWYNLRWNWNFLIVYCSQKPCDDESGWTIKCWNCAVKLVQIGGYGLWRRHSAYQWECRWDAESIGLLI